MTSRLSAVQLLHAYATGYFPMADSRNAEELYWYSPEERGILPLNTFHVPRSLQKFMRNCPYEVKFDTVFEQVIRACADTKSDKRQNTWINDEIIQLYMALAQMGHAHSVECWQDGELTGGLYGVSLGGAFFGESMFSRRENASKIALVYLVERLRERGFTLLDTQYTNDHLTQFGVKPIPKEGYLRLLNHALKISAFF